MPSTPMAPRNEAAEDAAATRPTSRAVYNRVTSNQ